MPYSKKKLARIAGICYLALIVSGVFAEIIVRQKLFNQANDQNILEIITANKQLLKIGFISDLIMLCSYTLLAYFLHLLLKKTQKDLANLFLICVVIAIAIMGANLLNHVALDTLPTVNFSNENLINQMQYTIKMHQNGYHIAQLFFGLWLLPLGITLIKSKFFPKFIGIFLIIGCFGYLIDMVSFFMFSNTNNMVTLPADIGEFSLCIYLLIKGVKHQ